MNNRDLILQYVDTGLILPKSQVDKLPSWSIKTYIRKRLISAEHGEGLMIYELGLITPEEQQSYFKGKTDYYLLHSIKKSEQPIEYFKLIGARGGRYT